MSHPLPGLFKSSVRYKLLALVFFPILLVMPAVVGLSVWWVQRVGYEQLFIKVNTDLAVAHDVFNRLQQEYLDALGRLGDSYAFRTALDRQDWDALSVQIDTLRGTRGFSFLRLNDASGRPLSATAGKSPGLPDTPLLREAADGRPVTGVEIFDGGALALAEAALAEQARLPIVPTPRARPTDRSHEERGMVMRMLYPVKAGDGRVVAILDGGLMLNRNFDFVDRIRDLIYGPGSLPVGSIGTVTLFLDDVRISTNVPLKPGERALGTMISDEVRRRVLERGETWIERAFVVNDWYISAYEPIVDAAGRRVGMLYAGFLERPFRQSMIRALQALLALFVMVGLLSAVLAIRGAKSIFKPIELMSSVVRATRTGEEWRVGAVRSRDELGELAREFDGMLDLLRDQRAELQRWGDELEHKVEQRTAELVQRNRELQRTIDLLRQTRRQLVMSEKLAALGELTAGVAHEINNPAAVIMGNMDVIERELGPALAPVEREAKLIIEQTYRIREIVNKLLQYARPTEYAGYLEDVPVGEVVRDTLPLVQHLLRKGSIEVRLALDATLPVRINRQELQQVLVNLIVNAVHAMEGVDGVLEIRAEDWDTRGVVISVRDNGCGIAEEHLSRIFNPFFTTKKQGEGTGLGLSVSYSLVRRYGGNLTATSTPGAGSEFRIWLLSEPEFVDEEQTLIEQLGSTENEALSEDADAGSSDGTT
ncbi:MAG: cache domain-containing protein [Ectothiorhodospiraceae bacterium]|jgi:two-component system NtrC family sensor kinase|nr:cache domain-containing protein [Ectothiorhodospiraceae bacterium]